MGDQLNSRWCLTSHPIEVSSNHMTGDQVMLQNAREPQPAPQPVHAARLKAQIQKLVQTKTHQVAIPRHANLYLFLMRRTMRNRIGLMLIAPTTKTLLSIAFLYPRESSLA